MPKSKTRLTKRPAVPKARAAWEAVRRAEDDLEAKLATAKPANSWAVLGSLDGADIGALAFLVLMQSSKSAQEDLKAIMARVKAINEKKAKLRELLGDAQERASRLDPDSFARAIVTMQADAMVEQIERDLASLSEMSEMPSLRLQMAMERISRMMSVLSSILKKLADTQQAIVRNIK